MAQHFELSIVIPCFNEENRLDLAKFTHFLAKEPNVLICFVNDGSSDNTLGLLQRYKNDFPLQIEVVSTEKNVGKAEAVRTGFSHCNTTIEQTKIAYLDADLATTLEECLELSAFVSSETPFVFGSRIPKIGNDIQRKRYRFYVGRLIASFIAWQLDLDVYDTQCGCKIFTKQLSEKLFAEKFISKWLFDVELFHRTIKILGKENMASMCKEIPLKKWVDQGESKVKMTYFFKLWIDLLIIRNTYKRTN